ncbi:unnamed protein product [Caenorhabditis nigoni]
MVLPTHVKPLNIEESSSKTRLWSHWFNIRIRQYMILEILLIISLIMIFYRLQTISNQNNQVIKMVSSMKSQISILESKIPSRGPNDNSKPLEQTITDALKNIKMEQPIIDLKQSKTEELITPPPPLNLSNNNSSISKKGLILNAADYLRGASVDNAHSSRSNLNPIIGYDQTNLVLLDRPQPPTHKAWCSNEHNPVLTINLAKYIKPIYVSYQHSKWTHDIPNSAPRTYDVVACLDSKCKGRVPLVSSCEYSSQSIGTEQFCNISSHLNISFIGKVQFQFKENYEDSNKTCVSLVRVYGVPKPEINEEEEKSRREYICNRFKWYYHNSFFNNTLMNKRCSILYNNDCCSDCPECCEQCVISDYDWEIVFVAPFMVVIVVVHLFMFLGIIALCYSCLTGNNLTNPPS